MSVKEDLIKYFNEGVSLGNSVKDLEKNLLDAGWPEEEIKEALKVFEEKFLLKKNLNKNYSLGLNFAENKKRPFGVTFSAILHWIIAFLWIYLFVFVLAVFSTFFGDFDDKSVFLINLGMGIAISFIPFIVGFGLWKGINAWRIVSIVFSLIFTLFSFFVIIDGGFSAIIVLLISLYLFIYLSFNKICRNYFKH